MEMAETRRVAGAGTSDWTIHSSGSWYHATLSNYFDYPFGNRPELPPFQITVKGPVAFKRTERVVVPIEVTAPGEGETLVDTDRGDRLEPEPNLARWQCGDGNGSDGGARGTRFPEWNLPRTGEEGRSPGARGIEVASRRLPPALYAVARPFRDVRLLQAGGSIAFWLFYDNGRIADGDKGEWVGTFSGPEFDINVAR